ncbi:MAG: transposase [Candidatus Acidoferrales bacterium]
MASSEDKLHVTRRHLPHWSLAGAWYFVTLRLRTRHLARTEIALLRDHVVSGDGRFYELLAVVVMPDHVHAVLRPRQGYSLSRVMKGIKGTAARRLNELRRTKGKVWQDESFDRIVRDQAELEEKLNYMFLNPVKAGLTDDPDSYPGWFIKRK